MSSAAGGYLTPTDTPPPVFDKNLHRLFNGLVVGITGLPGANVRPKYQAEPPNQAEINVNWAAFQVITHAPEPGLPTIQHHPTDLGTSVLSRHYELDVLFTFYGADAMGNALLFMDGVQISQNMEVLQASGIYLIEALHPVHVPDTFYNLFVNRVDVMAKFRRRINRTYNIRNVLSSTGEVNPTELGAQAAWDTTKE